MVTGTEYATVIVVYTFGYLTRYLIGIFKQAYKDTEKNTSNKIKENTRWDG